MFNYFCRELRLREDQVTDGYCRDKILSYATVTVDDYFVAPPGNIPVTPKKYSDCTDIQGSNDDEIIMKKLKKT